HGLVVHSELGNFRRQVNTPGPDGVKADYSLILLACKAYDLDSAMAAIAPAAGPSTGILPFVNGLSVYDRLDARFGKARVLGGAAYIATMLDSAGDIHHYGANDVVIAGARSEEMRALARDFHSLIAATPGVRSLADDVEQVLWDKWVMVATGALMTCLMRGTVGDIMATREGGALMARAMAECRGVAAAAGRELAPDVVARMESRLLDRASDWAASMARDIAHGVARLEADDIVGDMAARAALAGLDAPLTRAAYCHLQVYENRQAASKPQPV
ncbi:MAG: ketopantoate reductase family protein, partial [Pollutimonas bauzanensis]